MDFITDVLKAHNNYRERHGVPVLYLDNELCLHAQACANVLSRKRLFVDHSPDTTFGENIYYCDQLKNISLYGESVVKAWYDEVEFYDFSIGIFSPKTEHFTQVIWKKTQFLGVGLAAEKGKWCVVAKYFPPGNKIGFFHENVSPLIEQEQNIENLDLKQEINLEKNVLTNENKIPLNNTLFEDAEFSKNTNKDNSKKSKKFSKQEKSKVPNMSSKNKPTKPLEVINEVTVNTATGKTNYEANDENKPKDESKVKDGSKARDRSKTKDEGKAKETNEKIEQNEDVKDDGRACCKSKHCPNNFPENTNKNKEDNSTKSFFKNLYRRCCCLI